jgi:predicted DNA-binding ribbon-helix-helix protein
VSTIDTDRRHGNLSSAIRLFVLDHYRNGGVVTQEPAVPRDIRGIAPQQPASVLRAE